MWIAALAGYALLQVLVIAVTLWLAARWLDRRDARGRRRFGQEAL